MESPSAKSNGDWVILFHGIADNRTGDSGHAEFLLRHGYSVVMMDSRAQGESGGDIETYGWKERYDTVAVTDALYASEQVRHLYALGVSLGAAIALQSAAVEPRIEAVAAEAPFRQFARSELRLRWASRRFLAGKESFPPSLHRRHEVG
jgi:alpha-beta hydrolase superfamily lysophospholipase